MAILQVRGQFLFILLFVELETNEGFLVWCESVGSSKVPIDQQYDKNQLLKIDIFILFTI